MPEDGRTIARVERVTLGYEDHGILTCYLHLDYGSAGQGAGGYSLDEPRVCSDGRTRRVGTAYGMEFVARLLRACGVEEWSKIPGRTVFALIEGGLVRGIEPLPTEKGERFMFDDLRTEFLESADA